MTHPRIARRRSACFRYRPETTERPGIERTTVVAALSFTVHVLYHGTKADSALLRPEGARRGQAAPSRQTRPDLSVFCRTGNSGIVYLRKDVGALQSAIPNYASPATPCLVSRRKENRYTTRRCHATPCHARRSRANRWWHLLPSW
jgi:hypothetical protein